MSYQDPVDRPTFEEIIVHPLNRAELRLADAYVDGRTTTERTALEQAVRSRGTAYLSRFRHTTEMSWRMPVLFTEALSDGRMTIDHFDTVWRRMDRHPGIRAEITGQELRRGPRERRSDQHRHLGHGNDPAALPEPENGRCPHVDQVVEHAVIDWLRGTPLRMDRRSGTGGLLVSPAVTVHRVRDIVDKASDHALEDLVRLREQSAQWETDADRRRRQASGDGSS